MSTGVAAELQHERTDDLLFANVDPGSSMETARKYLANAPPEECLKRGMIKADPAFLFLMSETTYLEFSIYDLIRIVDTPSGEEAVDSKERSMQARMFGIELRLEGTVCVLWLAVVDATAKQGWVDDLRGMIDHTKQQLEAPLDKQQLSWEINFADLSIGRCLGMGAFGTVHAGVLWGTDVAVKKLNRVTTSSLSALESEIKVLSAMRHPNIVLYIGASMQLPQPCVVMEWCVHGSLDDLLVKPGARLSTKHIVQYALDIAQGLNYLHAQQPTIVHRDMKAANVFVDANYTMKVGDFGLAAAAAGTETGGDGDGTGTIGSPAWMAPETWSGSYGPKVDVWAYGQTLVQLLTRQDPLYWLTTEAAIQTFLATKPSPESIARLPAWVPVQIRKLVHRCLRHAPKERPSFEEIIEEVKGWFPDWTTATFYELVDYKRLEFLLQAREELQICALKEIAVLEAHAHASEISIHHLDKEKTRWFMLAITNLLSSKNKLIKTYACAALGALFERMTKATMQDDRLTEKLSRTASHSSRGSMALVMKDRLSLSESKDIVGNQANGLRALLELLVEELKDFYGVVDTRLLGLSVAKEHPYHTPGAASSISRSRGSPIREAASPDIVPPGLPTSPAPPVDSAHRSVTTGSRVGTAPGCRPRLSYTRQRSQTAVDLPGMFKQERKERNLMDLLFGDHTPLQAKGLHLLRLLLGVELEFGGLSTEQIAFLSKLVWFEHEYLHEQKSMFGKRLRANEKLTQFIASLSDLSGGDEVLSPQLVQLADMAQSRIGRRAPSPLGRSHTPTPSFEERRLDAQKGFSSDGSEQPSLRDSSKSPSSSRKGNRTARRKNSQHRRGQSHSQSTRVWPELPDVARRRCSTVSDRDTPHT